MKSIGIVAEFNPFHNGHSYLIREARKLTGAETCVSVMSSDFTQRGDFAIADKWERAEKAVRSGVDLVVELPVVYACSSAERFAEGGVKILEGFGMIDGLAFGSESGDLAELTEAARVLTEFQDPIQEQIRERIRMGESYPRARSYAVKQLAAGIDSSVLEEPNNILAAEYLKQIHHMEPVTIQRSGDSHTETASRIRARLQQEQGLMMKERENRYFLMVRSAVLKMSAEEIEKIDSAGEGLGRKLLQELRYADSLEALIMRVKSKAYTRTRIQRLLTQCLLGINKETVENAAPYIRVLAFNDRGAAFLREVKKQESATLPILTNINRDRWRDTEIAQTLEKEILASDCYNLICNNDLYERSDHVMKPFIGID